MRNDLFGRRSSHVVSAFVGLDVHAEHTFATVLDRDGRVVAQRRMMNEHVPNFLRLFNVEKVGGQVAQVAAARRLLMCCWSILKNKRPYHDQACNHPRGSAASL